MKALQPNITCSGDGNIKAYSTYNNILILFRWLTLETSQFMCINIMYLISKYLHIIF